MRSFLQRGPPLAPALVLAARLALLTQACPVARAADLVPIEPLGLRVTRGFRVTLFADANLANDVYAMTLDARGNPVITSQGYIKTLYDNNGDGVADAAALFAPTQTGGMGLCFDGSDFLFVGDGALLRFQDRNFDGVADGPPENLLPLDFAEHGGHAVRKGPDGWWYVMAGNETHFTNAHVTLPNSPIRNVEAGALLRISPDGRNSEVVAHGFRNPYDFDFNWLGDLFTYDSDVESDFFLPWYSPTRFYHIGHGQHHGWRLAGWLRSWGRPDYYADTVDVLYPIGRGSPTGVTCYRHYQFPSRYQDGLFALDWTFGKVYFLPLQPLGASYRTEPEVFLEPIGTHGFAPTDVVVTPDGSLLISIGGRKTRGSVYRIEYVAEGNRAYLASNWVLTATSDLDAVLKAPQPLDAWSRAYWVPIAARLGPAPFAKVVANNRMAQAARIRAVEILTELHGGLSDGTALEGAGVNSAFVRARVAWSLGRMPSGNFVPILLTLSRDVDAMVRRCALDALADRAGDLDAQAILQGLGDNLGHLEKRVRLSAARLATHLPEAPWKAFWAQQIKAPPQTRLTTALALLWRNPKISVNVPAVEMALGVLAQDKTPDHRLEAIRLIILAIGDYHLYNPSVEVYTAYEPASSLQGYEGLMVKVRTLVRPILPSGNATVDLEAARLLAMLEDNDPASPRKILSYFSDLSSPTADFHYLTVLSRLKGPLPTNATAKIAHTILSLDRKLQGREQRNKQNWTIRLTEVVQSLMRRDPQLADGLIRHPDFASPGHVALAVGLGSERYLACARRFLEAIQKNPTFAWSGPLIDLLAALPAEQAGPLFRKEWSNLALRDALVVNLARHPQLIDRDKFITGLASLQSSVARASMSALLQLPREESGKTLVPALRLLRRLLNEPSEQTARAQLLILLNRESGQTFKVEEQNTDPDSLKSAYQPIFNWFARTHPTLVRQLDADQDDPATWNLRLKSVLWDRGDPALGEAIFRERGCQTCHAGDAPIGPDLGGATGRFSVTDLFNAIIFPNRDVAPPYRVTIFHTRDGGIYSGIVVFESADGVMLQTGPATSVRLAANDIAAREPSNLSLMPGGLLAGLKTQELADLYSYLKILQPTGR